MKRRKLFLTILCILLLFLTPSCGLFDPLLPKRTATPTLTPTNTSTPTITLSPTITPTPTIKPPNLSLQGGRSILYGRVLWEEKPVKEITMNLRGCDEYYIEETDDYGIFIFDMLPPCEYTIKGDLRHNALEGTASVWSGTINVPQNMKVNYGEYRLLKNDLVLISPEYDSEIDNNQISFTWEPYPDAAWYKFSLLSGQGQFVDLAVRTDEPSYTLQDPLIACHYWWDVTAFNENGIPLARSNTFFLQSPVGRSQHIDGKFIFTNDELGDCIIQLTSPISSATIYDSTITFQWETQPLVVRYHLSITGSMCGGINCFSTHSYNYFSGDYILQKDGTLSGPLVRSFTRTNMEQSYTWRVDGYDQNDLLIAVSEPWFFNIPSE